MMFHLMKMASLAAPPLRQETGEMVGESIQQVQTWNDPQSQLWALITLACVSTVHQLLMHLNLRKSINGGIHPPT